MKLLFYVIILILIIFCQLIEGLYEDQIGKFDWRQQFVGRVNHVLRTSDIWQDHQLLITSSHSGTISGLHLRNGTINFRNILETSSTSSSSFIDYLSSWPKTMADFSCPVLTVNGHGRWIRCWKTSGVLISEHFLPNDFLDELSKNDVVLFERIILDKQPSLFLAKISKKSYIIESYHYEFHTKRLKSITKFMTGKWLDHSECKMINTANYMICLDQKEREFQFLDLNSSIKQFKRIPLSTFGLTNANNSIEKISIELLPDIDYIDKTTTISTNRLKSIYFAINLGNGQGIVIFKIVSNNQNQNQNQNDDSTIRLVKIFPYANRVTIIPLISSSSFESTMEWNQENENREFAVAVMFTKSENIPYEDKRDEQFDQKVFAIKLAIFHLETWQDITSSISAKSILFEFGGKQSSSPIVSNGKLVKRLDNHWNIDRFEIIPIRTKQQDNRFINNNNGKFRYTYKMLLTTIDGTIIVTNLWGKINWSREESLAEVNNMIIIDLPISETDATLEQEYGFDESISSSSSSNIVTMFITRIRSQLLQILSFVRQVQQNLMHSMIMLKRNNRNHHQQQQFDDNVDDDDDDNDDDDDDDDNNNNNVIDDDDELLVRDYFGFHKLIIARTKIGKIFAINTKNGKIIWSRYEPLLMITNDNDRLPIWIQRTNAHYPYTAISTLLNVQQQDNNDQQETFLLSFDPFNGKILDHRILPYRIIQTMLIQTIHNDEFEWPLLFMDSNLQSHLYPDDNNTMMMKLFDQVSTKHFMMIVNKTDATVNGYSFTISKHNQQQQLVTNCIWNYRLPHESNKLISIQSVFKRSYENVHSQGRVLGNRNVLYKYLNPNLVAILVESLDSQDKSLITMYLIDSITGNIIYSIVHRRTRCPCQVVHSENSIIYSFYNDKMRRNEISSIELYEGFEQINSTAFSSFGRDLWSAPNVEQKSFIFPTGIGIITDTETMKGITSKHILISLPTGGILELPRAFLDPRRPIRPTQEHAEEGLIPYVPELPIPSETIINYNQTVFAVRGIATASASLESTSLICVYGMDIFYTRVAPSKTFDILKDDFDHLLIMAVLLSLITMSYLVKYLAAKKSLNAAWK